MLKPATTTLPDGRAVMRVRRVLSLALTGIALLAITDVRPAEAGPITCSGIGANKSTGYAIVDPALSCTGNGVFGAAGSGPGSNDSVTHLNGLGSYGNDWELLTGISVPGNTNLGSFLLDPAASAFLCTGGLQCVEFIVAIKWDGLMAYFLLGSLLSGTTIGWETQPFALSHINVYGRLTSPDPNISQTPEPGTLALVGFGLAFAGRAMRKRRRKTL